MKSHLHISNTATKYFPSKMRVTEEASFFLFLIIYKRYLRYNKKRYYDTKISTRIERCVKFLFLVTIKEKKGGENHKFIDVH